MTDVQILPGTGRWQAPKAADGGGPAANTVAVAGPLHHAAARRGPPSRAGEEL